MPGPMRRGSVVAVMLLCAAVMLLSAAALPAQAPPPPVSIFFSRDIWHVAFLLAHPEAVREIRFRSKSDGAGAWSSATREPSPVTHEPSPVISVNLPLSWARPGRQKIEIALVGKAGEVSGPYILELDLEAEAIALAKEELGDTLDNWASFGDSETWSDTLLSFSTPFRLHDALREIRYSLDRCDLGQRIPMHSKPGFFNGPEWQGESYLRIPKSVSYACAQLVFRDGTTLGPLRIEHHKGPEPPPDTEPCRHFPARRRAALPASPAPVSLYASRSNTGWRLSFLLADLEGVREIRYRLDGAAWTSTGTTRRVSPHTGRRYPNTSIRLPRQQVTPGQHRLEVQLVDASGRAAGPYTLWFDPAREVLENARRDLNGHPEDWAFLEDRDGRTLFSINSPFSYKDALREMRYSFNGCALDQRFPFQPWNDLAVPPSRREDTYLWLPDAPKVSSACVQLVYCDGEASAPRRFPLRPWGRPGAQEEQEER